MGESNSLLSEEIEVSKTACDEEARDLSQEGLNKSNFFLRTCNFERDLPSSDTTDTSDDDKRTMDLQNCIATHSEGDKSPLGNLKLPQKSDQSGVDICDHLDVPHQSDEAKGAPDCRVLANERKELEITVAGCTSVAHKAVDKASEDEEQSVVSMVVEEKENTSYSARNKEAGVLLMVRKHLLVRISKTIK